MNSLDFAIKLAKEAGKIHLKHFRKISAEKKEGRIHDIITKADIEAEKLIIQKIKSEFPEHAILAEESGVQGIQCIQGDPEYLWIIDPLDGTVNYFRGHRDFCVMIALAKNEKVIMGVIYFPITEELFCAQMGKGAFKNGKKIKVSKRSKINDMFFSTQLSITKPESRARNLVGFQKIISGMSCAQIIITCAGRDLCDISEGLLDCHFKHGGIKYWDYAAGSIIISEAGGKATDFENKAYDQKSDSVVFSNGNNHYKIIRLLKQR